MVLQLGVMTNQELADWFQVKHKTFVDGRKGYLQKLQPFAEFQIIRGGVLITKVNIEEYVKNLNDDVNVYLEAVKQAPDNIASIKGISQTLEGQPGFEDISIRTIEGRMSRAGEKAFGVTVEKESRGIYGSREYIWAVKLYDRPNHYRELTEEEDTLFEKLIEEMYDVDARKIKVSMLLDEEFFNTEMTKEEYKEHRERINYMGINFFSDVIQKFKI